MKHAPIESVNFNQQAILSDIATLHLPEGAWYDADVTYGKGAFWKGMDEPRLKFDIDPQHPGVIAADNRALPLADSTLKAVVCDPPF